MLVSIDIKIEYKKFTADTDFLVVLLLLTFCLLLLPLWESVIVLCFVVRYFMSILVLQSTRWGRESWLLCLICLPGVSWWLSGFSSRCHGVVCSLWLWYFLIILTYYFLCYFNYSYFKQIIYSMFICLYKIWLCDNQNLIVKLPKQYKNKEVVKISSIILTQTIVLVCELTPWMHFVKFSHQGSTHSYA